MADVNCILQSCRSCTLVVSNGLLPQNTDSVIFLQHLISLADIESCFPRLCGILNIRIYTSGSLRNSDNVVTVLSLYYNLHPFQLTQRCHCELLGVSRKEGNASQMTQPCICYAAVLAKRNVQNAFIDLPSVVLTSSHSPKNPTKVKT